MMFGAGDPRSSLSRRNQRAWRPGCRSASLRAHSGCWELHAHHRGPELMAEASRKWRQLRRGQRRRERPREQGSCALRPRAARGAAFRWGPLQAPGAVGGPLGDALSRRSTVHDDAGGGRAGRAGYRSRLAKL